MLKKLIKNTKNLLLREKQNKEEVNKASAKEQNTELDSALSHEEMAQALASQGYSDIIDMILQLEANQETQKVEGKVSGFLGRIKAKLRSLLGKTRSKLIGFSFLTAFACRSSIVFGQNIANIFAFARRRMRLAEQSLQSYSKGEKAIKRSISKSEAKSADYWWKTVRSSELARTSSTKAILYRTVNMQIKQEINKAFDIAKTANYQISEISFKFEKNTAKGNEISCPARLVMVQLCLSKADIKNDKQLDDSVETEINSELQTLLQDCFIAIYKTMEIMNNNNKDMTAETQKEQANSLLEKASEKLCNIQEIILAKTLIALEICSMQNNQAQENAYGFSGRAN